MTERAMDRTPTYSGAERRRHRVYLTRNTEYHFRDDLCVAVRDRRSGEWLTGHLALRRPLFGSIRFLLNGSLMPHPGEPRIGEALFFAQGGRDVITSPLESVGRPAKDMVEQYRL